MAVKKLLNKFMRRYLVMLNLLVACASYGQDTIWLIGGDFSETDHPAGAA